MGEYQFVLNLSPATCFGPYRPLLKLFFSRMKNKIEFVYDDMKGYFELL